MFAKVTAKAQITLPKGMRDQLGIAYGDRVSFKPINSHQYVVERAKQTMESFACLQGIGPAAKRAYTVEEMDKAVVQAVTEKYRRSLPKTAKRKK